MRSINWSFVLTWTGVFIAFALMFSYAFGQTPGQVVNEMSPEKWMTDALALLMAGIGLVVALAVKTAVNTLANILPDYLGKLVKEYVDDKRQRDMTKSITSAVSTIIKEGRWTGNAKDFIDEIKANVIRSTPEAAAHNNVRMAMDAARDEVIANVANRVSIDVQATLAQAQAAKAMAEKALGR